MRRGMGILLMIMCAASMLLSVLLSADLPQADGYSPTHHTHRVEKIPLQTGSVDVNHGDIPALTQLPRIGPVIAQAIVDEREMNGRYFYPEDLLAVRGIGEKTLAEIRDLVHVGQEAQK